jgi:hypothetical protein
MKWEDMDRHPDRTLHTSDIEEIRTLVDQSIAKRLDRLNTTAQNLKLDDFEDPGHLVQYRDVLYEEAMEAEAVRQLGEELSVLALMKKVELRLNSVLRSKLPQYRNTTKITFGDYRKALSDAVYDALPGKREFRELLLICNSLKHNGLVSADLAREIPHWAVGAEFKDLNAVYDRLKGPMVEFIYEYVTAVYARVGKP